MATIAVMGASGNIGGRITDHLLAGGHTVPAIGRSAEKTGRRQGARGGGRARRCRRHGVSEPGAHRGADGAFTLLPPNPVSPDARAEMDRIGTSIAEAIETSGVGHAIALSAVGADVPSGTGPIAGLHAHEARLQRLTGTNVLVLRPGFFFRELPPFPRPDPSPGDQRQRRCRTDDPADDRDAGHRSLCRPGARGARLDRIPGAGAARSARPELRRSHADRRRGNRQAGPGLCAVPVRRLFRRRCSRQACRRAWPTSTPRWTRRSTTGS